MPAWQQGDICVDSLDPKAPMLVHAFLSPDRVLIIGLHAMPGPGNGTVLPLRNIRAVTTEDFKRWNAAAKEAECS